MRIRFTTRRHLLPALFGLFINPLLAASAPRLDEGEIRADFRHGVASVQLPIENPSTQPIRVRIQCEILDRMDRQRAGGEFEMVLGPGLNHAAMEAEFDIGMATQQEPGNVFGYRLSYRIESPSESAFEPLSGLVSLARVSSDLFRLLLDAPRQISAGSPSEIRVQTYNPVTGLAVQGVDLQGYLSQASEDEYDTETLRAQTTTDAHGLATLHFPATGWKTSANIRVVASKGDFIDWAIGSLYRDAPGRLLLSVDKPLYQPGQSAKLRVLAYTPHERVFANRRIRVDISSVEKSELVFSRQIVTSDFGVADTEWSIPDDAAAGSFEVTARVEPNQGEKEIGPAFRWLRVDRHELPNFVVHVEPDAPYYLPGQPAKVKVRAEYLSGQPVASGSVRLVRTQSRYWSGSEPVKNQVVASGGTVGGVFETALDLESVGGSLDEDLKYLSLRFTAYFTDPSTAREEKADFSLKVVKETLLVSGFTKNSVPGLPVVAYLSAHHLDRSPAMVRITLTRIEEGEADRRVTTVRTNRFGVAKVILDPDLANRDIRLDAQDEKGLHGTGDLTSLYNSVGWLIQSDRAIHAAGDPIVVEIRSSTPDDRFGYLDVVGQDGGIIHSEPIVVRAGRLKTVIPYQEDFAGLVTVVAYSPGLPGTPHLHDSVAVAYPATPELTLRMDTGGNRFKPRDAVKAHFQMSDESGRAQAGTIGLLVFDRAVQEQARSQDIGGNSAFLPPDRDSNWDGLTLHDLTRPDLARPAPDDFQVAAERWLAFAAATGSRSGVGADLLRSGQLFDEKTPFGRLMLTLRNRLRDLERRFGLFPTSPESLDEMLGWFGFSLDRLRDPWGNRLRPEFEPDGSIFRMRLTSAGADERFDSGDDSTPVELRWPYFSPYSEIMREVLADFRRRTGDSPHDPESFKEMLRPAGVDFDELRDPWGNPYRLAFRFDGDQEITLVQSSGRNGRFDNIDDPIVARFSWPYFTPVGTELTDALTRVRERTGQAIDDGAELAAQLRQEGFYLDALRDRWGRPYRVELKTVETNIFMVLTSGGDNGVFEQPGSRQTDDFEIWRSLVGDTFKEQRQRIVTGLRGVVTNGGAWSTESALSASLAQEGVDLSSFSDYWGRPLQPVLSEDTAGVFRVRFDQRAAARGAEPAVEPLQESFIKFRLISWGEDGVAGTADDFDAVFFTFPPTLERSEIQPPPGISIKDMVTPRSGAIFGRVVDISGGVLPGVEVTLRNEDGGATRQSVTDGSGHYVFRDLPPEMYQVDIHLEGFVSRHLGAVPVLASVARRADVALDVGSVGETVTVSSVQTMLLTPRGGSGVSSPKPPPVRNYFPETLVWIPSLPSDRYGVAETDFRLADSVTTWKMEALASTLDGRLATAESEITAFQPFFLELNPPPNLTQGDEVEIQPVVRNYLDHNQTVRVSLKPEDWMGPRDGSSSPLSHATDVGAGGFALAPFRIRADSTGDSAKIQVTAVTEDAADAIEKAIAIKPDGERITTIDAAVLTSSGEFAFSYPMEALPGTLKAELVVFPGFLAHAVDSAEALLHRPHGCAEQTISVGLTNLMVLKALSTATSGSADSTNAAETGRRARRLVQESVDRLSSFQVDGGFAYWSSGDPSPALTAYALNFLAQAADDVSVDYDVLHRGLVWLSSPSVPKNLKPLTAATSAFLLSTMPSQTLAGSDSEALQSYVAACLDSLGERIDLILDPQILALDAYAALADGRRERAVADLTKLEKLARMDHGQASWVSPTGSAFYGWGLSGSVETTALTLRALVLASSELEDLAAATRWRQLALEAAAFLTTHKDAAGGWQSTRSTVEALSALLELSGDSVSARGAEPVEVWIDGRKVTESTTDDTLATPVRLDLSPWIGPTTRHVEIHRRDGHEILVQFIRRYYRAWSASDAGSNLQAAGGFQLNLDFDKSEAGLGEPIEVHVQARRHNWPAGAPRGMALLEIGLPPGAEVERDTLEAERVRLGWRLGQYHVAPDHLTVYLWPGGKPIDFRFVFRPRLRMDALSSASRLYDYYNPAAEAKLAPIRFVVK